MAKPRAYKGRSTPFILRGGPFNGSRVKLHSAGTMAFSVQSYNNGELGFYNHDCHWVVLENGKNHMA